MQSMNNKNSNNYPRAKIYAKYALFMIICDIVFTLLIGVFATGFTIACRYGKMMMMTMHDREGGREGERE